MGRIMVEDAGRDVMTQFWMFDSASKLKLAATPRLLQHS
jgi:hypothetical protein